MAGILVFIPKSTSQQPSELVRVGLGPLLDASVDAIPTPVPTGPDGGPGMLWTFLARVAGAPTSPREVDRKTQEWSEAPPDGEQAKGRFWLGYVVGRKPSAAELQRASLFDGEAVELRDGQMWVVPIGGLLPRRLALDPETGEEVRRVATEHLEFDKWANAMLDLFMSDGFQVLVKREHRVLIPGGMRGAAMALAKNYRVTIHVLDLLDLVGEIEAVQVAMVASGITSVQKVMAQKKSTAERCQLAGVS